MQRRLYAFIWALVSIPAAGIKLNEKSIQQLRHDQKQRHIEDPNMSMYANDGDVDMADFNPPGDNSMNDPMGGYGDVGDPMDPNMMNADSSSDMPRFSGMEMEAKADNTTNTIEGPTANVVISQNSDSASTDGSGTNESTSGGTGSTDGSGTRSTSGGTNSGTSGGTNGSDTTNGTTTGTTTGTTNSNGSGTEGTSGTDGSGSERSGSGGSRTSNGTGSELSTQLGSSKGNGIDDTGADTEDEFQQDVGAERMQKIGVGSGKKALSEITKTTTEDGKNLEGCCPLKVGHRRNKIGGVEPEYVFNNATETDFEFTSPHKQHESFASLATKGHKLSTDLVDLIMAKKTIDMSSEALAESASSLDKGCDNCDEAPKDIGDIL